MWVESQSRLSSSPTREGLDAPGRSLHHLRLSFLTSTEKHFCGSPQLLSLRTIALEGMARASVLCTELQSSSTYYRKDGRKIQWVIANHHL